MDTNQTPRDAAAVTPSDTTPCNGVGFMVGVAGDVAVVTDKGTSVTLVGCQPGIQYALQVSKILSTGTTATSIVVFR